MFLLSSLTPWWIISISALSIVSHVLVKWNVVISVILTARLLYVTSVRHWIHTCLRSYRTYIRTYVQGEMTLSQQTARRFGLKKSLPDFSSSALSPLSPVSCSSRLLIVDDSITILRVTSRCLPHNPWLIHLIFHLYIFSIHTLF